MRVVCFSRHIVFKKNQPEPRKNSAVANITIVTCNHYKYANCMPSILKHFLQVRKNHACNSYKTTGGLRIKRAKVDAKNGSGASK